MHIDTDEANAAGISMRTDGELVLTAQSQSGDIVGRRAMHLGGKRAR